MHPSGESGLGPSKVNPTVLSLFANQVASTSELLRLHSLFSVSDIKNAQSSPIHGDEICKKGRGTCWNQADWVISNEIFFSQKPRNTLNHRAHKLEATSDSKIRSSKYVHHKDKTA